MTRIMVIPQTLVCIQRIGSGFWNCNPKLWRLYLNVRRCPVIKVPARKIACKNARNIQMYSFADKICNSLIFTKALLSDWIYQQIYTICKWLCGTRIQLLQKHQTYKSWLIWYERLKPVWSKADDHCRSYLAGLWQGNQNVQEIQFQVLSNKRIRYHL